MTKIKLEVFAAIPRLSDEDPDIMEREDCKDGTSSDTTSEGWRLWDPEDMGDILKIISRLEPKQKFIMEAFLEGMKYKEVKVTEKYWRYHFNAALLVIKKELGV